MGPYRDSISLKKSPLLGLYTGSEAQLDLATVRYHALGAYAKSVYLVLIFFLDVDCDCVRCPTILMLTLFFILMLMHKVGGTPRMHIKVLNWYWIQVEGTQWLEFRKCQFNFFLFRKKSSKSTRSF